jgi:hypothetical protein
VKIYSDQDQEGKNMDSIIEKVARIKDLEKRVKELENELKEVRATNRALVAIVSEAENAELKRKGNEK